MVLSKEFLDHPKLAENLPVEDPIMDLTAQRKIAVYFHNGAWHCMDTPQHFDELNKLWNSGKAGWKTW